MLCRVSQFWEGIQNHLSVLNLSQDKVKHSLRFHGCSLTFFIKNWSETVFHKLIIVSNLFIGRHIIICVQLIVQSWFLMCVVIARGSLNAELFRTNIVFLIVVPTVRENHLVFQARPHHLPGKSGVRLWDLHPALRIVIFGFVTYRTCMGQTEMDNAQKFMFLWLWMSYRRAKKFSVDCFLKVKILCINWDNAMAKHLLLRNWMNRDSHTTYVGPY